MHVMARTHYLETIMVTIAIRGTINVVQQYKVAAVSNSAMNLCSTDDDRPKGIVCPAPSYRLLWQRSVQTTSTASTYKWLARPIERLALAKVFRESDYTLTEISVR